MRFPLSPRTLLSLIPFIPLTFAETSRNNTGDQPQGYQFGFTTSNLPLPIVYTCPTPITISPSIPIHYGGPDASGPYYMMFMVHEQLVGATDNEYEKWYTHTEVLQDLNNVRTINNPWMNGTQFIACVWAANGVSGGCQVSQFRGCF
jgi:hypothetical protein